MEELARILRPFLRKVPLAEILSGFQEVLGFPVRLPNDIILQKRVLITFNGYRMDVTDLRAIDTESASIVIQFKAKKKWWHGFFRDQNVKVIQALQSICRAEIADLKFSTFSTKAPPQPYLDDGELQLVFFHDSRALNREWKEGYDVSPLSMVPDCHHGNCFIEFLFNGAAYSRSSGATVLRKDWLSTAFSVSKAIEQAANKMLGLG